MRFSLGNDVIIKGKLGVHKIRKIGESAFGQKGYILDDDFLNLYQDEDLEPVHFEINDVVKLNPNVTLRELGKNDIIPKKLQIYSGFLNAVRDNLLEFDEEYHICGVDLTMKCVFLDEFPNEYFDAVLFTLVCRPE